MTGKELKRFALMLHDDATVQVNWGDNFRAEWKELNRGEIQATLKPADISANQEEGGTLP
jgi:hypothetical protein